MAEILSLQQPTGEGGIESVRFFNGRLLTAADLAREQDARRQGDARLASALGDGVAAGLEVTLATLAESGDAAGPLPAVTITPGLALNRAGQALRLGAQETVRLSRIAADSPGGPQGCSFGDCAPAVGGTYVAGQGLYLLIIAPAEIASGRAPANGLSGAAAPCNVDRVVEAVQFRLLAVPPHLQTFDAAAPGYRNAVAHACFGSGVRADWGTDLLRHVGRDGGLVEQMRGYGLSDHDVPLAVIAFAGAAVPVFLDCWAVRRPVSRPDPGPGSLPSLAAPRRPAVGEAIFRQFQQHLAELVGASGNLGGVTAQKNFPVLPPVGILPHFTLAMARDFFAGMEARGPLHINSAQLEPLVRESLSAPAFPAAGKEVFWLYAVADNRIAAELANNDPEVPDPYLVFSTANLAYRADARFNLHRWDYANIALSA